MLLELLQYARTILRNYQPNIQCLGCSLELAVFEFMLQLQHFEAKESEIHLLDPIGLIGDNLVEEFGTGQYLHVLRK